MLRLGKSADALGRPGAGLGQPPEKMRHQLLLVQVIARSGFFGVANPDGHALWQSGERVFVSRVIADIEREGIGASLHLLNPANRRTLVPIHSRTYFNYL